MAPVNSPNPTTTTTTTTPRNPPIHPNSSSTPTTTLPSAPPTHTSQTSTPRKRKRKETPHTIHQSTYRNPTWTYFHLSLTTPLPPSPSTLPATDQASTHSTPSNTNTNTNTLHLAPRPRPSNRAAAAPTENLDPLTTLTLLKPPLTAYLGLTGSSIPIDILHTRYRDVWIRVPRRDARGVRAGLMGWVGACGVDLVPGVEDGHGDGEARVRVVWRVVGEGGSLGALREGAGGGRDLFGGV